MNFLRLRIKKCNKVKVKIQIDIMLSQNTSQYYTTESPLAETKGELKRSPIGVGHDGTGIYFTGCASYSLIYSMIPSTWSATIAFFPSSDSRLSWLSMKPFSVKTAAQ